MAAGRETTTMDCIFCKLAAGEIPCDAVLETERVLAFRDIRPQAPSHVLVIPRAHLATVEDLDAPEHLELAGELLQVAGRVARAEGLEGGWRLIANARAHGGQEVDHVHLHVLGGRPLGRMLARAETA